MSDMDSTNPVAAEAAAAANAALEAEESDEPFPARRRTDADSDEPDSDSVILFGPDADAPFPAALAPEFHRRRSEAEVSNAIVRIGRRSLASRRSSDRIRRRLGGLAYFGAAAAMILAFESLAAHRRAKPPEIPAVSFDAAAAALPAAPRDENAGVPAGPRAGASGSPAAVSTAPPLPAPASAPAGIVRATRVGGDRSPASANHASPAVDRRGRSRPVGGSRSDLATARRIAEDARFRAAWARIEAERREASDLAAGAFSDGKAAESDADRLMREGKYEDASRSFEHATQLFRGAEDESRQARLARIRFSAPSL